MTLAVSGQDAGATRGRDVPGWLRRSLGSLEEYFCYLLLVVLVVTTSLQAFELWFICALLYLMLTFTLSLGVKYLERRMVT